MQKESCAKAKCHTLPKDVFNDVIIVVIMTILKMVMMMMMLLNVVAKVISPVKMFASSVAGQGNESSR